MPEYKGGILCYVQYQSIIFSHLYLPLSDTRLKAARKSKLSRISVEFNIVEEISEVHQYR